MKTISYKKVISLIKETLIENGFGMGGGIVTLKTMISIFKILMMKILEKVV